MKELLMKKQFIATFVLGILSVSAVHACQYGIGWTRTAEGLVKKAYGQEAQNIEVGEIKDKSFYLFTLPNGWNCPDQIRAVTKVSFNYRDKSCDAKVILKASDEDSRIKRVSCY
jgi:hypothetical protein